jgi:hypothetical protein
MKEKEEKEREIWVGKNRFYLDENNILHMTIVGEIDEKLAREFIVAYEKFYLLLKGRMRLVLADINKAGKASSEARKLFRMLSEEKKANKTAIFGMHPVSKVIASFFMGVSRNKDIRFFNSKETAMAWLKE